MFCLCIKGALNGRETSKVKALGRLQNHNSFHISCRQPSKSQFFSHFLQQKNYNLCKLALKDYLRKIQCIFWPRTISNHDLLARCQQEDMGTIITRKRWHWIGHVLRKDANSITKVAIRWTPEGKQKRGRPKTTMGRTVAAETKNMNHSWGTIQGLARDRGGGASLLPYAPTGMMGSN